MRINLLPLNGNVYKANLHCHTKEYDHAAGLTSLQIKELYKSHGYNIVAFTHRKLVYYDYLNDNEFLALPALEEKRLVDLKTRNIYHFNCFPKHCGIKENSLQTEFEYSLESANKIIKSYVDDGYLVVYNHPLASFHEAEGFAFLGLEGIFAIEIYNNIVEVINRTGWSDIYYDMMLRRGHKIWAIAADDAHSGNEYPIDTSFATPYSDCMGGFVMIKAKELSQARVINALENGDFYSCVGKNGIAPQIHNMYIEDNIFYADFAPVKSVYLKNSYWHCPHKLSFNDDITHVEFEIDKTWTYIRLEITDSNGYKALGNPYFLT
jgi:hypothetical protein